METPQLPESPAPQCTECGYILTGLGRRGRCPECGYAFDADWREPVPAGPGKLRYLGPPLLGLAGAMLATYTVNVFVGLAIPVACLAWILTNAVFLADWYQRWTHFEAIRSRRPRPSRLRTVLQSLAVIFVSLVFQAIV